jgi:hypothetical protein
LMPHSGGFALVALAVGCAPIPAIPTPKIMNVRLRSYARTCRPILALVEGPCREVDGNAFRARVMLLLTYKNRETKSRNSIT